MILRGRTSRTGVAIIGCCLSTAAWAAATATGGVLPLGIPALLDSFRLSAWLHCAVALFTVHASEGFERSDGAI